MDPHILTDVVTLMLAGAGIAYVCFRLGLVPIAGFLIAGVVIGPNALALVRDPELVDAAADIGVLLLLFTIGIEFSLERLAAMKRAIFVGGGLQVALTALVAVAVLLPCGIGWRIGLFTGFLIALSSTAIVVKLLADRSEITTPRGRIALGILIFQDLAVVMMVLLVPVLAGAGTVGGGAVWALGKAAALIAVVLVVARRLMPAVLEQVARTCAPELFLLTVIAICFGTAFVTSLAGVSLSLGAFLAGLVVSESRFSQHALSEILPLQILFSATFFVSVGMLLDARFVVTHLPLVAAGIAAVLLLKVLTGGLSVLALGEPVPVALGTSLMLAQVGEFSFVLERAGRRMGLSPAGLEADGSQAFIATTVVLMVLTPFLTALGGRVATRPRAVASEPEPVPVSPAGSRRANHVVVAGYGQAARRLVRVLDGSRIPFVITTLSPDGANEAEAGGLPVLRGDASQQHTLLRAGADQAKVLVVADDDPAMAHRIVAVARLVNPTMRIVVRTRYIIEMEPLAAAGADRVIAEELESVVQLFADVMRSYDLPVEEIARHEDTVRHGGYAALRAAEAPATPLVTCDLSADCLGRRTVTVRAGAPAATLTVGDLPLVVERLRRDGRERVSPPRDEPVRPGDELVLASTPEAFAHAAPLFRVGTLDAAALADAMADVRTEVDTERTIELHPAADTGCGHLDRIHPVTPSARGCEECLRRGDRWVHLRICMSCGHVGCCDSSPNKHATAHAGATGHPIIKSLEPGEEWGWCYPDAVTL